MIKGIFDNVVDHLNGFLGKKEEPEVDSDLEYFKRKLYTPLNFPPSFFSKTGNIWEGLDLVDEPVPDVHKVWTEQGNVVNMSFYSKKNWKEARRLAFYDTFNNVDVCITNIEMKLVELETLKNGI
jgi:hypothetical protein